MKLIKFIGSTAEPNLSYRMCKHRYDYKNWENKKRPVYVSSYEILKFEDAKIILIEDFPCDNRDQLRAREQYWLDEFKSICINRQKADTGIRATTPEEADKLRKKQYYQENKEKIKVSTKEYYEKNAVEIYEKKKIYNEKNAEKMAEYKKNWSLKNEDRIKAKNSEKYTCNCGQTSTRAHKIRHEKSKKHQAYLTTLQ